MINRVSIFSSCFSLFISSLTLCSTSSFLTRSRQLISILLHHYILNSPGISNIIPGLSIFQQHKSCGANVTQNHLDISQCQLLDHNLWSVQNIKSFLWNVFALNLNVVVVRQPHSLTTLLISTLLFSPWSSLILTHWSIYSLLISLLSRHPWSLWFALIWFSLQAQILSASLWRNHAVLNLCPKCGLILLSTTQLRP
jgi:hypothetical protein